MTQLSPSPPHRAPLADINECTEPRSPCAADQLCTNKPGGYECSCQTGYIVNRYNQCEDVDECRTYGDKVSAPAVEGGAARVLVMQRKGQQSEMRWLEDCLIQYGVELVLSHSVCIGA